MDYGRVPSWVRCMLVCSPTGSKTTRARTIVKHRIVKQPRRRTPPVALPTGANSSPRHNQPRGTNGYDRTRGLEEQAAGTGQGPDATAQRFRARFADQLRVASPVALHRNITDTR